MVNGETHWKTDKTLSEILASPTGDDASLLDFRLSFHRPVLTVCVRFIDSSPIRGRLGCTPTSSTRIQPRSVDQSGIPIPDRRAPCIYWLSNFDTQPCTVDELSIPQVLSRFPLTSFILRRRLEAIKREIQG